MVGSDDPATSAMDVTSHGRSSGPLAGKRILIVGAERGGLAERGRFHVERARDLGVEVVTFDESISPSDHEAARGAVERLNASAGLDGIVTFLEEWTELGARLQQLLGLPGHSVAGTEACRNKVAMRDVLRRHGLPVPRYVHLNDREQARAAARSFPMPAFLKPVDGSGSVGTRRVADAEQLVAAFDDVVHEIRTLVPDEFARSIIGPVSDQDANLMLEEYLAPASRLTQRGLGRVGIEVLVQNGDIVFFAIGDGRCVSPTDHRYESLAFPSRLTPDDVEQFRALARGVVRAFELSNGPVILDAVMTDRGPQLYEINARSEGAIMLPLITTCYGVDLVEETLKIAAGIPVDRRSAEAATAAALLHMILAPAASRIARLVLPDDTSLGSKTQRTRHVGDLVGGPEAAYDAIAMVTMTAANRAELDDRLERYLSKVTIEFDR